jgi:hypothetical protein
MRRLALVCFLLIFHFAIEAEELRPETVVAFTHYVDLTEQRMSDGHSGSAFFQIDALPPQERNRDYVGLKKGEVISQKLETLDGGHAIPVPNGLIHHWTGIVFIPRTTLARTLAFLQDYDNQARFYAPDVQRSKLLARDGDEFKVFMRLRKTKVVTVILDTEYDIHYIHLDAGRAASRSYSTRITEVQNAGKADESEKLPGLDSGFMWKLNSYWKFLERDGGVYVQLEAISLTRDIPTGLGWMVRPFVTSIPQESVNFTLSRTREALTQNAER